jgi:hypothetical protein
MFLRRHRKEAGGEDYEYWSLVKTIRTARGPRHQIVARLGKLDRAEVQAARGWEDLDALLEGLTPRRQLSLTPEPAPEPLWKEIDVRGVKVERLRQFGRVYLGLALWRRLGLHRLAARLMPPGQEEIGWDVVGCILTLGRFCAQPSELSLAERGMRTRRRRICWACRWKRSTRPDCIGAWTCCTNTRTRCAGICWNATGIGLGWGLSFFFTM